MRTSRGGASRACPDGRCPCADCRWGESSWQGGERGVAFLDRLWNLAEVPRTLPAATSAAAENAAEGNSTGVRAARWLLLLALVLGLLRFFRLGHWSLWIDESLTYTDWHVGLEGGE